VILSCQGNGLPATGDTLGGLRMQVLVLGGTGWIGRPTAERLAATPDVSQITIASRNGAEAQKVASTIGSKAVSAEIDVHDHDHLVSLASKHGLVVNAAGPDYKVAYPVARAAVAAGAHCVDISADPVAVERILALDSGARASEVAVITGIGHAPGISNLMMLHAARQLDAVEEVHFDVNLRVADFLHEDPARMAAEFRRAGRVSASWETLMKWVAGPVRTLRDGRLVEVDPSDEVVEARPPIGGPLTLYPLATTEPITMPRHLPGVMSLSFRMSWFPPQINEMYLELGRRIRDDGMDPAEATIALIERIAADPARWLTPPPGGNAEFLNWATAIGWKDGRRVACTCWPVGNWMSTVAALTVAAREVTRREFRRMGVFPPEAAFEPEPFLAEVAAQAEGLPPRAKPLALSMNDLE